MLEVAVAAVVAHLDVFGKVIEISPELFEGLPWTESELRRMRGRVDWDPYAVLLDRLGERCKHDEVIRAVGATMDQTGMWLAVLLQAVVAPLQLLQFWERMVPKLWRPLRVQHLVLGDDTVEVSAELLPGYRGCRTMFVATATAVATSMRRIGLPPMQILSASTSDRHGTYVYRLPPSRTVPDRLVQEWESLLEFLSSDDPPTDATSTDPERIASSGAPSIRSEWAQEVWGLTTDQTRVLELVVQGHANKEIATALAIDEGSVEEHVDVLLRRATATNRTMLVYRFWTLEAR